MSKTIYGLTVDYSGWAALLVQQTRIRESSAREAADELEAKVVNILKVVASYDTGKAVLEGLAKSGKAITIKNGIDGFAKPLNPEKGTLQGEDRRQCEIDAGKKPSGQKGKGGGTDVDVLYMPNNLECSGGTKCAGNKADEVLLHELTHALRYAAGVSVCRLMTGKYKSYSNEEEFYAIVISNIYLSEKGSTELRADHGFDMGVLDAEEQKNFAKRHKDLLATLKSKQEKLYEALTKIEPKGGFNPIRELK